MSIAAIETTYAGCRFRSRLEARWAVFFDSFGIPWMYEPEGYVIDGRLYLPDFYLPECATWVEVKGHEGALDKPFLRTASKYLPQHEVQNEAGPRLMVVGSIPESLPEGDFGWVALTNGIEGRYGFGAYHKNKRPWFLDNGGSDQEWRPWLQPTVDQWEWNDAQEHYGKARRARFEHGQSGA